MKLTAHQLRTVAFLCTDVQIAAGVTERVPGGTAFFVAVEEGGFWFPYAITAGHCVEAAGGGPLYLRVNVEDTFEDVETRVEDWFVHDSADVALAPFVAERPAGGFNLFSISLSEFVNRDYTVTDIGPISTFQGAATGELKPAAAGAMPIETGDEVVFVGLFVQHAGSTQNLPIARFGHISRMPIEPVSFARADGTTFQAFAYLVESRSWGGHSGSPVYWSKPAVHPIEIDTPPDLVRHGKKLVVPHPDAHRNAFLGLVSGHFDIEQPAITTGDIQGSIKTAINSGIAVVTPAEAVRELLMREDVVADRKKGAQKAKGSKKGATLDSAKAPEPEEQPFTRERFLGDLTKATQPLDGERGKERS